MTFVGSVAWPLSFHALYSLNIPALLRKKISDLNHESSNMRALFLL
jgi:hypothetical protein